MSSVRETLTHAGSRFGASDTLPRVTDTQPKAARPPRQEQEPASDEVTEVAPGVLRMQLPIWMPGLGHVNMYGLVDDRGLTVSTPACPVRSRGRR